jgi:acetolactate synthase I/II/III large subunit
MKLAHPDRRVVHVVGDGSFYFNNPSALYAVAREYRLPIFTVILDNSGWSAVKESVLRMYPNGKAHETDEFASRLPAGIDYAATAEAAGAYGERLADPREAAAAIARCLQALSEGRSAVLHARVTPL